MSMVEDDIDAMLAAMPDSKTFVLGALSGPCVVDSADRAILASGSKSLLGKIVVATVRTTKFPEVKNGDPVTIDTTSYKVRGAPEAEDDGLTMRVSLEVA